MHKVHDRGTIMWLLVGHHGRGLGQEQNTGSWPPCHYLSTGPERELAGRGDGHSGGPGRAEAGRPGQRVHPDEGASGAELEQPSGSPLPELPAPPRWVLSLSIPRYCFCTPARLHRPGSKAFCSWSLHYFIFQKKAVWLIQRFPFKLVWETCNSPW